MTERNKLSLVLYAKLTVLFIWGALAIINFAGVMNYCPESFVKWCAAILLIGNGVLIWRYGKRLVDEKNAQIVAIQQKEREELVKKANSK